MKEKIIDLKYGKLHLIKTKKFRTINVKVILYDEFKREDIIKRNFLTDYLTLTTKKYNTKTALALRTQELYSLYLSAYNVRTGNHLITRFNLSFLDPKYTEESMFTESIQFLHEVIFEPNVKNFAFDEELFKTLKKDLKTELETIRENPKIYTNIKMFENLDNDKPYSYNPFGYIEDLEKITPKNLYEYYKEFLTKNQIDIYVVGDFDEKEVLDLVKEKLDFKTIKKEKCSLIIPPEKKKRKIKEIVEESNFGQSKLAIGCKVLELSDFEYRYALNLYNMILGGGFNSKFMQEIREKDSLAYYISSSVNKADNIILIQSGISYPNYHKVISSVKAIMKKMIKGEITPLELTNAKMEYISILEEIYDNIDNIAESFLIKDLMNLDDFEVRKKMIEKVTVEDIKNVSKKVCIDTIYLLKGVNDGKN